MNLRKNILYIYTDGSMTQTVRKGGMGLAYVYLDCNEEVVVISEEIEGIKGAAIGQMELTAVIEGLKLLNRQNIQIRYTRIEVRTDSRYVVDNFKNALYNWPKKGWRKINNAPVENYKEWKELVKERRKLRNHFEITWVKGHSKDIYNKLVDKSAKESAQKAQKILKPQTDVRRKLFEGKTKEGSVVTKGQRIDVLIISAKSMKPDNLCKYRYQVLSKNSQYFKMIDFVYSYDYSLKINHCYRVTFKRSNQPPMINKIICEIERPKKCTSPLNS